jgi:hypothetical protein
MNKDAGLRHSAVEQVDEADGREILVGCQGCLPPLILVVSWLRLWVMAVAVKLSVSAWSKMVWKLSVKVVMV